MPPNFHRPPQGSQTPARPNLISQFQTPDGKLDFNKISATAHQVKQIYNQVNPLITQFIKK
ncbi:YppG family protein [Tenuibacillus multivorans]